MTPFPAANLITNAVFVLCLLTMALGAGIAVFSSRLIRSVCGLAICCIGLAGLYYFLHSPFLALMEILIYVGAVCVTIVFAVMLAEPDEPARTEKSGSTVFWGGLALLVAAAIFCGLVWLGARALGCAGRPAQRWFHCRNRTGPAHHLQHGFRVNLPGASGGNRGRPGHRPNRQDTCLAYESRPHLQ